MKKYLFMCAAAFVCVSCASDPGFQYPDMLADVDPFSIGSVSFELDQIFSSKLKEVTAEVTLHPRENKVSLEFRHELITYRQFWDAEGRLLFIDALRRYTEDYENESLVNKYRTTRSVYGKTKSRVEWQSFRFTKTRRAAPYFDFGYRFIQKAPYFTVFQRAAQADKNNSTESAVNASPLSVFFTRAQAGELAKLFDQALLRELAGGIDEPSGEEAEVDEDAYNFEETVN